MRSQAQGAIRRTKEILAPIDSLDRRLMADGHGGAVSRRPRSERECPVAL